MSALSDAISRCASFYNGNAYDPTNLGGMDNDGHEENFIPALRDVATIGQGCADYVGMVLAAADQQEAWGPSFTTVAGSISYISATSFSLSGDMTGTFTVGKHLTCDCGVDGLRYGVVSGSILSDDLTIITVSLDSGVLTPNLKQVKDMDDQTIWLVDFTATAAEVFEYASQAQVSASNAGLSRAGAEVARDEAVRAAETASGGPWSLSIPATYLSNASFSASTDLTGQFSLGVRVQADCGADGLQYGTVASSSYADPTTTVTLEMDSDDALTSNLVGVRHGNDNQKSLVSHAAQHLPGGRDPLPLSQQNSIIGGNFDFWFEGTSQTTSGYGSDTMSRNEHSGSTKTHSQGVFALGDTDTFDAPAQYYSRTVVTSVAGSGNYVRKTWRLEDVTRFVGVNTFTFRGRVPSGAANIAIEFRQYCGAGGSTDVTGIGSQLVALGTEWEKKSVTVAIPSCAGKTIGAGSYLEVIIWYDAGSDYATRVENLGQQSGTFDIAQVKLELGEVATPFVAPDQQQELSRVQRYLYTSYPSGYTIGSTTPLGAVYTTNETTTLSSGGSPQFKVTMVSIPSVTIYSTADGAAGYVRSGGINIAATAKQIGTDGFAGITASGLAAGMTCGYHIKADCRP